MRKRSQGRERRARSPVSRSGDKFRRRTAAGAHQPGYIPRHRENAAQRKRGTQPRRDLARLRMGQLVYPRAGERHGCGMRKEAPILCFHAAEGGQRGLGWETQGVSPFPTGAVETPEGPICPCSSWGRESSDKRPPP